MTCHIGGAITGIIRSFNDDRNVSIRVEIEGSGELKEICSRTLDRRDDLTDHYLKDLFPLLDMEGWVRSIIDQIPEDRFTTFGTMAKALGSIKASRSVGTICSDIGEERVLYSDGTRPSNTTPPSNGDGGRSKAPREKIELDIRIDDPPFRSLEMDQKRMRTYLKTDSREFTGTAGIDISSGKRNHCCALCHFDSNGNRGRTLCITGKPGIPYVSGFLFYREGPLMLPTILEAEKRGITDDGTLYVIDGNGRLHPRRMGLACQIGIASGRRTCGVAKRLMVGTIGPYRQYGPDEDIALVTDANERIGVSSRRRGGSPIFISAGNGTDLDDVTERVIALKNYRLPEPTRWAHRMSNRCRRSETPSGDLEVLSLPLHV